jgi:hypothetical protein
MSGKPNPLFSIPGAIHVSGPTITLSDERLAEFETDPEMAICCMGAAVYGPDRCTCWEPVYSDQRLEPQPGDMIPRESPCVDGAYRHDSAEFQDEDGREHLEELTEGSGVFVCHQGMPYVKEWRHPSGRVIPMTVDEVGSIHTWEPIRKNGVHYKANGEPANLCAGWFTRRMMGVK